MAWEQQKELKKIPLPNPNDILLMAQNEENIRDRALFIISYLTGGRVSEILSLRRKNFIYREIDMGERVRKIILVKDLINEKNRQKHFKDIPIPIDKEFEAVLWNLLYDYTSSLGLDELLFNISKRRAHTILTQKFGLNPHFLRHIRASHLIIYYDFNETMLTRFMGWTDSRPAKFYISLKWEDMLQKI